MAENKKVAICNTFAKITNGVPNMILFPNTPEETIGYFTPERVNRDTIPDGWHLYEVRNGTSGQKATIEPVVMVNFGGSFITNTPITFPNESDKYRNIRGKAKKLT